MAGVGCGIDGPHWAGDQASRPDPAPAARAVPASARPVPTAGVSGAVPAAVSAAADTATHHRQPARAWCRVAVHHHPRDSDPHPAGVLRDRRYRGRDHLAVLTSPVPVPAGAASPPRPWRGWWSTRRTVRVAPHGFTGTGLAGGVGRDGGRLSGGRVLNGVLSGVVWAPTRPYPQEWTRCDRGRVGEHGGSPTRGASVGGWCVGVAYASGGVRGRLSAGLRGVAHHALDPLHVAQPVHRVAVDFLGRLDLA